MSAHVSILAWRISWAEEPGGLQCMGSQRVGHDYVTDTSTLPLLFTFFRNILITKLSFGILLWYEAILKVIGNWWPLKICSQGHMFTTTSL